LIQYILNFLQAQTRAKVARVKAEMRTVATAAEAYLVDYNRYPMDAYFPQFWLEDVHTLTTPIDYISSVLLIDPFKKSTYIVGSGKHGTYQYYNYMNADNTWMYWVIFYGEPVEHSMTFVQTSWGPDFKDQGGEWVGLGLNYLKDGYYGYDRLYDPTNGTVSAGDICRLGGDTRGVPQVPNK
jgi:general secretion pathway protein G